MGSQAPLFVALKTACAYGRYGQEMPVWIALLVIVALCHASAVRGGFDANHGSASKDAQSGAATSTSDSPRVLDTEEVAAYKCQWMTEGQLQVSGAELLNQNMAVHDIERVHYRELTRTRLLEYVSQSKVLIVTGLVEGWPAYTSWNRTWFIKTFAKYGQLSNWAGTYEALDSETYEQVLQENPSSTYLAWTAGIEDSDSVNDMMRDDLTPFPNFLPPAGEYERLVHWVYTGFRAAGATTHRDSVCEGTWTAQVKGDKQWCFSTYPGLTDGKQVFYAATQEPGDMLIFTIPMWHGTHLLSESFSIHGYFPLTMATQFNDRLQSLTRHDPILAEDYAHCFDPLMQTSAPEDGVNMLLLLVTILGSIVMAIAVHRMCVGRRANKAS